MSGAAPRQVAEPQLGNFGQSPSVGIPLGMRLDVWNDSDNLYSLNLYARNGQSINVNINQNAAVSLSGRLFSSVTFSNLDNTVVWALVEEFSPPTWGPVSALPQKFLIRITDPYGNAIPVPWNGTNTAPAQGRFIGVLVSEASGDVTMLIGGGPPTLVFGDATAAGQLFPFTVFIDFGQTVSTGNAIIAGAGITL